jgi:hypothetical protein
MTCMSTYRHERIHLDCRNARDQSERDVERLRNEVTRVKARMECHRIMDGQLQQLMQVDEQELLLLTESLRLELS